MRRHPTADELTAAALPGEQAEPATYTHLTRCQQCFTDVESLRTAAIYTREAMALEPGESPPPSVWQAIQDELGDELSEQSPKPAGSRPRRAAHREPSTTRRRRRPFVLLPAALVAAALAAVIVLLSGERSEGPTRELALVSDAPGVGGSAQMVTEDGTTTMRVELTVPGGPPAGHQLEVLVDDGGTVQSLGALTETADPNRYGGSFQITGSPGDVAVDVSIESLADPASAGTSLAHSP